MSITRGGVAVAVDEKLIKNDFRFVEKLLYQQKTHDSAIAEMEAELEEMVPDYSSSIIEYSHDKPHRRDSEPERWTIIRNESIRGKYLHGRIAERKRHKKAITEAKKALDDLENQLVYLKYDLEKSSRDCWLTMGLQKSRFYEMREEIVVKVARFLGLI